MSGQGHSAHDSGAGGSDEVQMGKIVAVGVISLIIFIISAVIAKLMLDHDTADLTSQGGPATATEIGKAEVGIVDQIEFDIDTRLEDWRAARKKRLHSYGWVDKSKGLVHIPIDVAIDQVVTQYGGGAPQRQP
jgi:hypothetical protein